jgi:hypothetical protein
MSSSPHVYEIRPRKDRRGIDLIGEWLPLGVLWFEGPDAIKDAVNYARSFSHLAIIRLLDESGTLAETLESSDHFLRAVNISARPFRPSLMSSSKSIARSKEEEATLARQQKQLEALTEALQKVSAQLELNNSALQTVQSLIESRFSAPNKSALATRMRRNAVGRARRRKADGVCGAGIGDTQK